MKIAVIGRRGLGGVSMRGQDVARVNDWEFLDVTDTPTNRHFDVLLLVKYHLGIAGRIRAACNRLVLDPLDCWESDGPNSRPQEFWSRQQAELRFDDVLATSPACAQSIMQCLPQARVHLLPHHADPEISPSWRNPSGPIVYAGAQRCIERHYQAIASACRRIGRVLLTNFDRRPLSAFRGAALHLHPRFPNTDSPLNQLCKPQVKLANAAASDCPILATPHPCFTTLKAGGCQIDHHKDWEELLMRALQSQPPRKQPTLEEHCAALRRILEC